MSIGESETVPGSEMKAALKASGAPTDADVKSNWDTGGFQDSLPARLPGARGAFVLTVRRILLICGATNTQRRRRSSSTSQTPELTPGNNTSTDSSGSLEAGRVCEERLEVSEPAAFNSIHVCHRLLSEAPAFGG